MGFSRNEPTNDGLSMRGEKPPNKQASLKGSASDKMVVNKIRFYPWKFQSKTLRALPLYVWTICTCCVENWKFADKNVIQKWNKLNNHEIAYELKREKIEFEKHQ